METDSRTKLLLVDDDPELRELIADYLARHGYAVATAHDGVAMDESLAAGGVDLVILDLMLPGEDGLAHRQSAEAGQRLAHHHPFRLRRGRG